MKKRHAENGSRWVLSFSVVNCLNIEKYNVIENACDSFWNNYFVFTASKGDHPPVSSAGTEVPHGQVGVLTLFCPGGLEHPPPLLKRFWSYGDGGRGFGLQKGLNGVYCQPSNGLKFNRQRSKKVIFTVNRKKSRLILTVKKFQGTSNLSISANLHGLHAPEESPNWKNHS